MPALFLVIVCSLVFAVLFLPDEVAKLRADALASFAYVTNWYLIFSQQSYFEAVGRPSLLRHLWSLAVEEQFYLIWPLVFVFAMTRFRKRTVLIGVAVAALVSMFLMAMLYAPGADPSRVYYGTDTRASGILIGVALAFIWTPGKSQGRRIDKLPFDLIGVLAFGALAGLLLAHQRVRRLPVSRRIHPDGAQHGGADRGGRASAWQAARGSAGIIGVGVDRVALVRHLPVALARVHAHPAATRCVAGWTSIAGGAARPDNGAGRPILPSAGDADSHRRAGPFLASVAAGGGPAATPARPALGRRSDGACRVLDRPRIVGGARTAAADACVSRRARRHPEGNADASRAVVRGGHTHGVGATSVVLLPIVALSEPTLVPVAQLQPSATPPIEVSATAILTVTSTATPTVSAAAQLPITPTLESTPRPTDEPIEQDAERLSAVRPPTAIPLKPTATATVTPTQPAPPQPVADGPTPIPTPIPSEPITAIGDSVMLGAAPILQQAFTNIEVDAEVGRQAWTAATMIKARKAENRLGSVVVLHLGNNGRYTEQVFNEIMQTLADRRMVIVFNVRVPREWEAYNNNIIANGVKAYPNAVFIDWRGITANRPELFWNDGHHLRPEGARFYAGLIAEAIKSRPEEVKPSQ